MGNTIIGGECTIGAYSFLGLNSTVSSGIKIGKNCIIGACSSILKNLPDESAVITSNDTPLKLPPKTDIYFSKQTAIWHPILKQSTRNFKMSNYTNNTTKTSLVDNYKINEYRILKELAISERSSFEKFPLFIQIETTSKCNSNCVMCPRSKTPPKRKRSNMGNSLKKKILSELINHRDHIRRVIPQGYGEPLLDIKLPEFIKKLKDIGIKEVFISTNGSALTKDMAKKILDSGIDQVDFSVDGITEKTYNSIRKGLKFSTVVKNIEQFIQIRNQKQSHTSIRLRYVIQQGNRHEYEPFVKFWQHRIGKNDSVYAKKLHTFGGHIDMPNTEYYIKFTKSTMHTAL